MPKDLKNNGLSQLSSILGTTPIQHSLFHVEKQIEIDGIQMGVLNNGTPYLTMRGLSRLCGVDSSVLVRLTTNWLEG
ncbi:hypothetical protein ABLA30_22555 [Xenorhabdus nematophila]|uniref:hypothetical protein n=1 Tax=Xenorhabdus nematophila TaxID=628 RepID=UPI0003275460|nr:hypothetical protein [Xenorhabdus nematophila]CCW31099.1 hypothetical protein XNC3_2450004 [Xenorhabdus nematophila F1]